MIKRYLKHETFAVACLCALLISLVYFHVVFFGKTFLRSLYSPHEATETGPYEYNGKKPENTFNIDLATLAYYEDPVNRLIENIYLREIFRVNGLVPGVLLDDGNHTVMFSYLPPTFLAGLILLILSCITCTVFFIVSSESKENVHYRMTLLRQIGEETQR
jgi:hypothetical protein